MTDEGERPPRPLLLIEDNDNDVLFFKRGLAKIHSPIPVQVIQDGGAAWEYLSRSGSTARPTLPSMILLDLKLPKMSGLEILASLKEDPELRRIPVVILSSSNQKQDIEKAYALGADFYLVKATGTGQSFDIAKAIHAYWVALQHHPDDMGADPSLSQMRKLAVS